MAGGGGVEALTDLVGTNSYHPGLGWLGVIGQLVQIGAAAACVLGGGLMFSGRPSGKAPAIYGLAAAVGGQVVVLIAGSSLVDASIVGVLIVLTYYIVVISQFPATAFAPAQTLVAVIIALVFVASLDWVLATVQSSSTSAVRSAGSTGVSIAHLTVGETGAADECGPTKVAPACKTDPFGSLHNDVVTPPACQGNPVIVLNFRDNNKKVKLQLPLPVFPSSYPSDVNVVSATYSDPSFNSFLGYTSGTVTMTSRTSGTFKIVFYHGKLTPGSALSFPHLGPVVVAGEFNCP